MDVCIAELRYTAAQTLMEVITLHLRVTVTDTLARGGTLPILLRRWIAMPNSPGVTRRTFTKKSWLHVTTRIPQQGPKRGGWGGPPFVTYGAHCDTGNE